MLGYVVKRVLQSIFSVLIVSTLTLFLVYSCVPRQLVFKGDLVLPKIANKPDEYNDYKFRTWEKLGYIDYVTQQEYAQQVYGSDSPQISDSLLSGSSFYDKFRADLTARGYKVEPLPISRYLYATKDVALLTRVFRWYAKLLQIDHPYRIQDPSNPDLKRGYYLTRDWNGGLALAASGTIYKYQIWVDDIFPFLHQNMVRLNMGRSYPTFDGVPVLDVISGGQGRSARREINTTVRGEEVTFYTSIDEHSLKYKPVLDRLDLNKFEDNYADGNLLTIDPSMLGTSFTIGMYSLLLSLAIGLTVGVIAAMKKDRIFDKITMAYIVFISSIPTLLYIALFARFGMKVLGLPDKFPFLGSENILSYILPTISLSLGGIAGEALWIRRYMVDQMNADYVKFSRSKGLSQMEVFFRHIVRNALIPIVHSIPMAVIGTLAGALITESFYAVPGMGKMFPSAISDYNNAMIIALTFIFTVISILAIFLGDILVTFVDPRISLAARKEAR
ncbi:MAG: ABC transporter permease [Spirochaetia bacterium]|jgi:oligopeptide transport system permease protein|nr:ABC transporter permease [Spirochaetia bacterium]